MFQERRAIGMRRTIAPLFVAAEVAGAGRVGNYVFNRIGYHVGSLTGASVTTAHAQAGLDPAFAILHTQARPDRDPKPFDRIGAHHRPAQKF